MRARQAAAVELAAVARFITGIVSQVRRRRAERRRFAAAFREYVEKVAVAWDGPDFEGDEK